MEPLRPAGLANTASAIQRGQARFDKRAERVTEEAQALGTDPLAAEVAAENTDAKLPADLAGLKADAIANSILYKVFQRQQEQRAQANDLLRPS
jgi:hypothetical protein